MVYKQNRDVWGVEAMCVAGRWSRLGLGIQLYIYVTIFETLGQGANALDST